MPTDFTHDPSPQRVVFAAGALVRVAQEAERFGIARALVIATPGSGARLGAQVVSLLKERAVGLHAEAVIHVPHEVATKGLRAAKDLGADGLIAVGGGSAIGLAKIIARDTALPIIAIPTTFSGSEATPIWGTSAADRKTTGRDLKVLPRTIIYDPELLAGLPGAVAAASALNAMAHCVGGLWLPDRTPVTVAYACEAMRRFYAFVTRAVADSRDTEARGECLIGAWLAGTVLTAGTGLNHKLAHVMGGYGLPHAETHAVLLPHTTRFNLAAGGEAAERLREVLHTDDPAAAIEELVCKLGITKGLRALGFSEAKIDDAAGQIAQLGIKVPRAVSETDARALISAAL